MKITERLTRLLNNFAPIELIVLIFSIATSIALPFVASDVLSANNGNDKEFNGFSPLVASKPIYDIYGQRVRPFDTSFYVNYLNGVKEEEVANVKQLLDTYLVDYHKLFDRHHFYYQIDLDDPRSPSEYDIANRQRVNNLRVINENLNAWVEVDRVLYDIIETSLELADKTRGFFNPFVGELTDFWAPFLPGDSYDDDYEYPTFYDPINHELNRAKLEEIVSFVPKTRAEITATVSFKIESERHYVRLNSFNGAENGELSLTLGGIAKGYMADILERIMLDNNLLNGYIFGGASTITSLNPRYFGQPLVVSMSSIIPGDFTNAFEFSREEQFRMSTSGTYQGEWTENLATSEKYLRSHIIDPFTGYPANRSQQLVSVISKDLSGTELEILSTSLVVMDKDEGLALIEQEYQNVDVGVAYLSLSDQIYSVEISKDFAGDGETKNFSSNYQVSYFEGGKPLSTTMIMLFVSLGLVTLSALLFATIKLIKYKKTKNI